MSQNLSDSNGLGRVSKMSGNLSRSAFLSDCTDVSIHGSLIDGSIESTDLNIENETLLQDITNISINKIRSDRSLLERMKSASNKSQLDNIFPIETRKLGKMKKQNKCTFRASESSVMSDDSIPNCSLKLSTSLLSEVGNLSGVKRSQIFIDSLSNDSSQTSISNCSTDIAQMSFESSKQKECLETSKIINSWKKNHSLQVDIGVSKDSDCSFDLMDKSSITSFTSENDSSKTLFSEQKERKPSSKINKNSFIDLDILAQDDSEIENTDQITSRNSHLKRSSRGSSKGLAAEDDMAMLVKTSEKRDITSDNHNLPNGAKQNVSSNTSVHHEIPECEMEITGVSKDVINNATCSPLKRKLSVHFALDDSKIDDSGTITSQESNLRRSNGQSEPIQKAMMELPGPTKNTSSSSGNDVSNNTTVEQDISECEMEITGVSKDANTDVKDYLINNYTCSPLKRKVSVHFALDDSKIDDSGDQKSNLRRSNGQSEPVQEAMMELPGPTKNTSSSSGNDVSNNTTVEQDISEREMEITGVSKDANTDVKDYLINNATCSPLKRKVSVHFALDNSEIDDSGTISSRQSILQRGSRQSEPIQEETMKLPGSTENTSSSSGHDLKHDVSNNTVELDTSECQMEISGVSKDITSENESLINNYTCSRIKRKMSVHFALDDSGTISSRQSILRQSSRQYEPTQEGTVALPSSPKNTSSISGNNMKPNVSNNTTVEQDISEREMEITGVSKDAKPDVKEYLINNAICSPLKRKVSVHFALDDSKIDDSGAINSQESNLQRSNRQSEPIQEAMMELPGPTKNTSSSSGNDVSNNTTVEQDISECEMEITGVSNDVTTGVKEYLINNATSSPLKRKVSVHFALDDSKIDDSGAINSQESNLQRSNRQSEPIQEAMMELPGPTKNTSSSSGNDVSNNTTVEQDISEREMEITGVSKDAKPDVKEYLFNNATSSPLKRKLSVHFALDDSKLDDSGTITSQESNLRRSNGQSEPIQEAMMELPGPTKNTSTSSGNDVSNNTTVEQDISECEMEITGVSKDANTDVKDYLINNSTCSPLKRKESVHFVLDDSGKITSQKSNLRKSNGQSEPVQEAMMELPGPTKNTSSSSGNDVSNNTTIEQDISECEMQITGVSKDANTGVKDYLINNATCSPLKRKVSVHFALDNSEIDDSGTISTRQSILQRGSRQSEPIQEETMELPGSTENTSSSSRHDLKHYVSNNTVELDTSECQMEISGVSKDITSENESLINNYSCSRIKRKMSVHFALDDSGTISSRQSILRQSSRQYEPTHEGTVALPSSPKNNSSISGNNMKPNVSNNTTVEQDISECEMEITGVSKDAKPDAKEYLINNATCSPLKRKVSVHFALDDSKIDDSGAITSQESNLRRSNRQSEPIQEAMMELPGPTKNTSSRSGNDVSNNTTVEQDISECEMEITGVSNDVTTGVKEYLINNATCSPLKRKVSVHFALDDSEIDDSAKITSQKPILQKSSGQSEPIEEATMEVNCSTKNTSSSSGYDVNHDVSNNTTVVQDTTECQMEISGVSQDIINSEKERLIDNDTCSPLKRKVSENDDSRTISSRKSTLRRSIRHSEPVQDATMEFPGPTKNTHDVSNNTTLEQHNPECQTDISGVSKDIITSGEECLIDNDTCSGIDIKHDVSNKTTVEQDISEREMEISGVSQSIITSNKESLIDNDTCSRIKRKVSVNFALDDSEMGDSRALTSQKSILQRSSRQSEPIQEETMELPCSTKYSSGCSGIDVKHDVSNNTTVEQDISEREMEISGVSQDIITSEKESLIDNATFSPLKRKVSVHFALDDSEIDDSKTLTSQKSILRRSSRQSEPIQEETMELPCSTKNSSGCSGIDVKHDVSNNTTVEQDISEREMDISGVSQDIINSEKESLIDNATFSPLKRKVSVHFALDDSEIDDSKTLTSQKSILRRSSRQSEPIQEETMELPCSTKNSSGCSGIDVKHDVSNNTTVEQDISEREMDISGVSQDIINSEKESLIDNATCSPLKRKVSVHFALDDSEIDDSGTISSQKSILQRSSKHSEPVQEATMELTGPTKNTSISSGNDMKHDASNNTTVEQDISECEMEISGVSHDIITNEKDSLIDNATCSRLKRKVSVHFALDDSGTISSQKSILRRTSRQSEPVQEATMELPCSTKNSSGSTGNDTKHDVSNNTTVEQDISEREMEISGVSQDIITSEKESLIDNATFSHLKRKVSVHFALDDSEIDDSKTLTSQKSILRRSSRRSEPVQEASMELPCSTKNSSGSTGNDINHDVSNNNTVEQDTSECQMEIRGVSQDIITSDKESLIDNATCSPLKRKVSVHFALDDSENDDSRTISPRKSTLRRISRQSDPIQESTIELPDLTKNTSSNSRNDVKHDVSTITTVKLDTSECQMDISGVSKNIITSDKESLIDNDTCSRIKRKVSVNFSLGDSEMGDSRALTSQKSILRRSSRQSEPIQEETMELPCSTKNSSGSTGNDTKHDVSNNTTVEQDISEREMEISGVSQDIINSEKESLIDNATFSHLKRKVSVNFSLGDSEMGDSRALTSQKSILRRSSRQSEPIQEETMELPCSTKNSSGSTGNDTKHDVSNNTTVEQDISEREMEISGVSQDIINSEKESLIDNATCSPLKRKVPVHFALDDSEIDDSGTISSQKSILQRSSKHSEPVQEATMELTGPTKNTSISSGNDMKHDASNNTTVEQDISECEMEISGVSQDIITNEKDSLIDNATCSRLKRKVSVHFALDDSGTISSQKSILRRTSRQSEPVQEATMELPCSTKNSSGSTGNDTKHYVSNDTTVEQDISEREMEISGVSQDIITSEKESLIDNATFSHLKRKVSVHFALDDSEIDDSKTLTSQKSILRRSSRRSEPVQEASMELPCSTKNSSGSTGNDINHDVSNNTTVEQDISEREMEISGVSQGFITSKKESLIDNDTCSRIKRKVSVNFSLGDSEMGDSSALASQKSILQRSSRQPEPVQEATMELPCSTKNSSGSTGNDIKHDVSNNTTVEQHNPECQTDINGVSKDIITSDKECLIDNDTCSLIKRKVSVHFALDDSEIDDSRTLTSHKSILRRSSRQSVPLQELTMELPDMTKNTSRISENESCQVDNGDIVATLNMSNNIDLTSGSLSKSDKMKQDLSENTSVQLDISRFRTEITGVEDENGGDNDCPFDNHICLSAKRKRSAHLALENSEIVDSRIVTPRKSSLLRSSVTGETIPEPEIGQSESNQEASVQLPGSTKITSSISINKSSQLDKAGTYDMVTEKSTLFGVEELQNHSETPELNSVVPEEHNTADNMVNRHIPVHIGFNSTDYTSEACMRGDISAISTDKNLHNGRLNKSHVGEQSHSGPELNFVTQKERSTIASMVNGHGSVPIIDSTYYTSKADASGTIEGHLKSPVKRLNDEISYMVSKEKQFISEPHENLDTVASEKQNSSMNMANHCASISLGSDCNNYVSKSGTSFTDAVSCLNSEKSLQIIESNLSSPDLQHCNNAETHENLDTVAQKMQNNSMNLPNQSASVTDVSCLNSHKCLQIIETNLSSEEIPCNSETCGNLDTVAPEKQNTIMNMAYQCDSVPVDPESNVYVAKNDTSGASKVQRDLSPCSFTLSLGSLTEGESENINHSDSCTLSPRINMNSEIVESRKSSDSYCKESLSVSKSVMNGLLHSEGSNAITNSSVLCNDTYSDTRDVTQKSLMLDNVISISEKEHFTENSIDVKITGMAMCNSNLEKQGIFQVTDEFPSHCNKELCKIDNFSCKCTSVTNSFVAKADNIGIPAAHNINNSSPKRSTKRGSQLIDSSLNHKSDTESILNSLKQTTSNNQDTITSVNVSRTLPKRSVKRKSQLIDSRPNCQLVQEDVGNSLKQSTLNDQDKITNLNVSRTLRKRSVNRKSQLIDSLSNCQSVQESIGDSLKTPTLNNQDEITNVNISRTLRKRSAKRKSELIDSPPNCHSVQENIGSSMKQPNFNNQDTITNKNLSKQNIKSINQSDSKAAKKLCNITARENIKKHNLPHECSNIINDSKNNQSDEINKIRRSNELTEPLFLPTQNSTNNIIINKNSSVEEQIEIVKNLSYIEEPDLRSSLCCDISSSMDVPLPANLSLNEISNGENSNHVGVERMSIPNGIPQMPGGSIHSNRSTLDISLPKEVHHNIDKNEECSSCLKTNNTLSKSSGSESLMITDSEDVSILKSYNLRRSVKPLTDDKTSTSKQKNRKSVTFAVTQEVKTISIHEIVQKDSPPKKKRKFDIKETSVNTDEPAFACPVLPQEKILDTNLHSNYSRGNIVKEHTKSINESCERFRRQQSKDKTINDLSNDTLLDVSEIPRDRTLAPKNLIYHSTPINPVLDQKYKKISRIKSISSTDSQTNLTNKGIQVSKSIFGSSSDAISSLGRKKSQLSTSYSSLEGEKKNGTVETSDLKRLRNITSHKDKMIRNLSSGQTSRTAYSTSNDSVNINQPNSFRSKDFNSSATRDHSSESSFHKGDAVSKCLPFKKVQFRDYSSINESSMESRSEKRRWDKSSTFLSSLTGNFDSASRVTDCSPKVFFRNRLSYISSTSSKIDPSQSEDYSEESAVQSVGSVIEDTESPCITRGTSPLRKKNRVDRTNMSYSARNLSPNSVTSKQLTNHMSFENVKTSMLDSLENVTVPSVGDPSIISESPTLSDENLIKLQELGKYNISRKNRPVPLLSKKRKTKHEFETNPHFFSDGELCSLSKAKPVDKWVSKELYKHLHDKLKPNHGIHSSAMAGKLLDHICATVCAVKYLNQTNDIDLATLVVRNLLSKYNICRNYLEFSSLIRKYTPFDFQRKVLNIGGFFSSLPRNKKKISDPIVNEIEKLDVSL